jgi:SET domain-containing protein
MLTVSTYLAPSVIEGLGVFAREYIPRGRLIWTLNPKFDIFINESEIDAYPPYLQDFMSRYTYPHLEMPGVVILDSDNGRFMNHSPIPNTDFRIFDRGYALVDIAVGEELTCNYYEFDPAFSGYPAMHAVVAENRLQASGG